MKEEIRVLGIDDGPHKKDSKNVLVIVTYFRGGRILDGILSTFITKDGIDSTSKLTSLVNNSRFKNIKAILLDGIALGGFNIIDLKKFYKKVKIPVIVIMRKYPNLKSIQLTLKKINMEYKFRLIKEAPKIYKFKNIYLQFIGITLKGAQEIADKTTSISQIPEPIRIAHIIAAGIINKESKGRA